MTPPTSGLRRVLRATGRTALLAGLVTGMLAGCAGAAPDLSPDAGARLRTGVLAVTRALAADDLPAARTALDALTGELASDRAAGEISPERASTVDSAIGVITGDLTGLEQAAATKTAADAAADQAAAARQALADQKAADALAAPDRPRAHPKGKREGG